MGEEITGRLVPPPKPKSLLLFKSVANRNLVVSFMDRQEMQAIPANTGSEVAQVIQDGFFPDWLLLMLVVLICQSGRLVII